MSGTKLTPRAPGGSITPDVSPLHGLEASVGISIAERIARCLPGASFELEALIRLVGVVETGSIPTAAVSCSGRSRLLVNPTFVAERCRRDEHLFLLVMHEMWHVLLGHTTLYPRPTKRHNIAFDALINAGLARQHPEAAYRGFFEELNSPDIFPQLLLRPPRGWPVAPTYRVSGPRGTRDVLRRLYPPPGANTLMPTYEEILELLKNVEEDTAANLLGDHRGEEDTADPMNDPVFGEVVRRIVEKWPPPPIPMKGRDTGGELRAAWLEKQANTTATRRAFAEALAKTLRPATGGARETATDYHVVTVGPGPLPNALDRAQHAKRRLGHTLVLPNQRITLQVRNLEPPMKALIYLDVSGSMQHILPYIMDLLVAPAKRGLTTLRQFSTKIEPLSTQDLLEGTIKTTAGTSINCVLEDALTRPERRILLITDGYVGQPDQALTTRIQEQGYRILSVLPSDGWAGDLQGLGEVVTLPAIIHGGGA